MGTDPFGFDKVVVNGEERKLTEFTPQITVVMTAIWIWEYCKYHGITFTGF